MTTSPSIAIEKRCCMLHMQRMHEDPEAITGVHHVHMTAQQMSAGQVAMPLQAEQSWALVFWQMGEALLYSMGIPAGLVSCDIWANVWCCSCWLEFGAYKDYAASYGERLRTAASYVSFWCANLYCKDYVYQLACDLVGRKSCPQKTSAQKP